MVEAAFLLALLLALASVFFPVVVLLWLANRSSRWVTEGGRGRRVVVAAAALVVLSAWGVGLVALEAIGRKALELTSHAP